MTAPAVRPVGALLWSRSLCFGVVAAALGSFGHWAVSGVFPGTGVWVGVVALAALGARWFLDRERGFGSILVGLVGVQLVLHLALAVPATHEHAGHSGGSLSMLLAHACATAAAAFWLRRGEALVWTRLRRAAEGALGFLGDGSARWRAPHPAASGVVIPVGQSSGARLRPLVDKISGRGPPPADRP